MNAFITDAQLEREIREQVQNEVGKIAKELQLNTQQKLHQAQVELVAVLKTIVANTFTEVFLETYGDNFNVNSLIKSVNCYINIQNNNLRPDIIYDKNLFEMNYSLQKDTKAFNDNVTKTNFLSILDSNELDAMYADGGITDYETPYDIAMEEIGANHTRDDKIFSPQNKLNRQGGFASLDETYSKATVKALRRFMNEYDKNLKPKIIKKYNLKLQ